MYHERDATIITTLRLRSLFLCNTLIVASFHSCGTPALHHMTITMAWNASVPPLSFPANSHQERSRLRRCTTAIIVRLKSEHSIVLPLIGTLYSLGG